VARDQIERFIRYANHLADVHHCPAERIPPEPAGPITLRRFRRTLAWFIHRLPGDRSRSASNTATSPQ